VEAVTSKKMRSVVLTSAVVLAALTVASDVRAGDRPPRPVERRPVDSIHVSADGKHVAAIVMTSSKENAKVRLVDAETSKEVVVLAPFPTLVDAGFINAGRSLVLSGYRTDDAAKKVDRFTCVFRLEDGADLCRPKDGTTAAGFAEIANGAVDASPDGEELSSVVDEGKAVEVRRADTGATKVKVRLSELLGSVASMDVRGDFLVTLRDGTLARVARADGKVVWRAEAPRCGDDTTPSPGDRVPGRPQAFTTKAWVTSIGTRAVVEWQEKEEWDKGIWEQTIVVAYDWKDGREVWRRRPDDQDMDEVFFAAKRDVVGFVHGRTAVVVRADSGEVAGRLRLEHEPMCIDFGASSDVGWGGTIGGMIFPVDLGDMKTE
jgi:hypothetical protein